MNKSSARLYAFEGQQDLASPQLVYYPALIRQNIQKMIAIAGGADRLWPHIKTHKMAQVVQMQLEAGIDRFKCATIAEAEMAAQAGAKRITLAYPLVGPNIRRFAALQQAFPQVEFFAIGDDTQQIRLLGQACQANVLMDVDMGQHRTGVALDKVEAMYREWNTLPGITMRGLHCYDGHRHESSRQVREEIIAPVDQQIEAIKGRLQADGLDCSILIMGGTPSFPVHAEMTGEFLSPGTCVIQDAGYRNAYPDLQFTPAAALLTRVISRPSRDTFTLDLGCKAVATDPTPERAEIVGMEYARTVFQNEEHWVVRVPEEHIDDIPPIGTELFALPIHVCPTSALYPEVPVVEDGKIVGWWKVAARDRRLTL